MDTRGIEGKGRETRKHRLPRVLTMAALVCFALPFLTVTCYGETTVSGVQAATGIDLYPNDEPGEAELVREEGPNAFALLALAAAIVALVLAFGSSRSRELPRKLPRTLMVWTPAGGAVALMGFFAYSFYRSWGDAWPRIGLVGALMCLVGAAWAGVGRIPRWVGIATAGVAASMIPGALVDVDDVPEEAWRYVALYAGFFIAVALAVGAVRAFTRAQETDVRPARPSTTRVVIAGIVGLALLAVAAVGTPMLMNAMLPSETAPADAGSSYLFAIVVVAITIAASVVAWIAGHAIAHGRRRVPLAPVPAGVGV